MSSPFPGMNPYLEHRRLWPDLHESLIPAIRDVLAQQVAPAYYVAIEEQVFLVEFDREEFVGRPDAALVDTRAQTSPFGGGVATAVVDGARAVVVPVFEEVREGYLEVRDVDTHEVVTVLELLSPTNKEFGKGRRDYEAKRSQVLHCETNLVEIDLLRSGKPMEMTPTLECDYRILVSRGWERPPSWVGAFGLRDPIPEVTVPLRRSEAGARLSLRELLDDIYDRARYDLRVDYRLPPPEPLLSAEDATWVDEVLRAQGLRR
jgi:Protein of unknown function (DUF4058)